MGLSFGLGCSLAAKLDNSERKIWVMIGDGETQEGQIWEAIMAADFYSSDNLKLIVDKNGIQNDDFVSKQMEVGELMLWIKLDIRIKNYQKKVSKSQSFPFNLDIKYLLFMAKRFF